MIAGDQYFGGTAIKFAVPLILAVIVAVLFKPIRIKTTRWFHGFGIPQEEASQTLPPFCLKQIAPSLFLLLLALGIILRLIPYLFERSFWGDETWVAYLLTVRSWLDILSNANLNSSQPLPQIGFVFIEKGLTYLFGLKEIVFRFFPWLCGSLACFFFMQLSRKILPLRAALIATAFFVLSGSLIYYAAELKPYSSEVLLAVLVYLAFIDAVRKGMDEKSVAQLMGWGLIALFISLSNAIVLISLSVVWGWFVFKQGRLEDRHRFLTGIGSWGVLFLACYFLYYREQLQLYLDWNKGYLRSVCLLWPFSQEDFLLFTKNVMGLFSDPVGLIPPSLTAIVFLWGCFSWSKKDPATSAPFLVTLVAVLLLAVLGKIPLVGRMLLFLLPAFYLVIAQGLHGLMEGTFWRKFLGTGILLILLIHPIALAARTCAPEEEVDIRSVTQIWRDHQLPEDTFYLNNESQWGIVFYSWMYSSDKDVSALGILTDTLYHDSRGTFVALVSSDRSVINMVYAPDRIFKIDTKTGERGWAQLPRSGRTWVLLTKTRPETEKFFLQCLDRWGKRLGMVKRKKAALYLYDLSGP